MGTSGLWMGIRTTQVSRSGWGLSGLKQRRETYDYLQKDAKPEIVVNNFETNVLAAVLLSAIIICAC